MIVDLISKNYSPSPKLKNLIIKKIERLDRFFEPDTKIKVLLKQSNEVYTLELTIAVDNGVLRAEVFSDNMFSNIDLALPKLEKQIVKHHHKVASKSKKFRLKATAGDPETESEAHRGVVKSKTYMLTPMSVEDAIEEQELVGHSFFVFLNKGTGGVNILYKRNDGDYGLIETQTAAN